MRILLIEDSPKDAQIIKELLEGINIPFNLFFADTLSAGLKRLKGKDIDVILLDLSLPDSKGLDTLRKIQVEQPLPKIPIVVMTYINDERVGIAAVHMGAQDSIIKGKAEFNGNGRLLIRVLRYAIERHSQEEELRKLALMDVLTGMYNRRGFLREVDRELKLARRIKKRMLLIYADLDCLKRINDTLGHYEGNLALRDIANIFKGTFRESDIIGRLGDDEFVVLAAETTECNIENVTIRLKENMAHHNAGRNRRYTLSLSLGVVLYDPESPCSLEDLVELAEEAMYENKLDKSSFKK